MLFEPLRDAWRHTFPKDLRFCRQCIILRAELDSVRKRYKDKKFIPRAELQAVANNWTEVPYPWMRWPFVRQVCWIRAINSVRCFRGRESWLFTRHVATEHGRFNKWLQSAAKRTYIPREQFEREVLEPFHVAVAYHRIFIIGALFIGSLIVFLVACHNWDPILYAYLRYWLKLERHEILDWWENVAMRHCAVEVPAAYKDSLPPTAVVRPNSDKVHFNVTEMISPDKTRRVIFLPTPFVGPRDFYFKAGKIMVAAEALMIENAALESLKMLPPSAFFPLSDEPFPAIGVHHRFYNIFDSEHSEPPELVAGSIPPGFTWSIFVGSVPFVLKAVFFPSMFVGNRADAKIGWGRLKDALGDTEYKSICVPWTPLQITNLKCSLFKEGWTVGAVQTVPWMDTREMGRNFCDYYAIEGADVGADGVAAGGQANEGKPNAPLVLRQPQRVAA